MGKDLIFPKSNEGKEDPAILAARKSLGNKKKFINIPLSRENVNLGRQVRSCVLLLEHAEGNNLGIPQVPVSESLINTS